jgi:hypothetical protein
VELVNLEGSSRKIPFLFPYQPRRRRRLAWLAAGGNRNPPARLYAWLPVCLPACSFFLSFFLSLVGWSAPFEELLRESFADLTGGGSGSGSGGGL